MRCPDCRLPLTYGKCDRCHPTAVAAPPAATGFVDVHQVDESGSAAGETRPLAAQAQSLPAGKVEDLSQLPDEDHATMAGPIGAELLHRIACRKAELDGYRARVQGKGVEARGIEPCEGIAHLAGDTSAPPVGTETGMRIEQIMAWDSGWERAHEDLGGDLDAEAGAAIAEQAECECLGTGELVVHADTCTDQFCAINGDVYSCVGQIIPCSCPLGQAKAKGAADPRADGSPTQPSA